MGDLHDLIQLWMFASRTTLLDLRLQNEGKVFNIDTLASLSLHIRR